MTPEKMLDYLKSRGCRIGGVTMGERGLLWYDETGAVRTLPALPIPRDRVIDTNGAGDVFHGAYVYSYLANPGKAGNDHFEFARAASTYKIQRLGNEAGLPTLADIEASSGSFRSGARRNSGTRHGAGVRRRQHQHGCGGHGRAASQVGETVAGKEVLYFPGGKGANQAVAAAKQGVPTTLIGRLGEDTFGNELRTVPRGTVDRPRPREGHADAHTGTAIITIANSDNTIVVIPGANALVSAADVAAACSGQGRCRRQPVRDPAAAIAAFFQRARAAGATTILNPAPARAVRAASCSASSTSSCSTKPSSASSPAPNSRDTTSQHASSKRRGRCSRQGQDHLHHAGQPRRARAGRRRSR